jgi:hypothetical protein
VSRGAQSLIVQLEYLGSLSVIPPAMVVSTQDRPCDRVGVTLIPPIPWTTDAEEMVPLLRYLD